jgi:hypothetical protein
MRQVSQLGPISLGAFLIIILGLFASAGCSYNLGFKERGIPGGYENVAIPVFKNQTIEAGTEVYFTNSIIMELERSRLAHIVAKDLAQVTLEGTVTSIVYSAENPSFAAAGSTFPTGISPTLGYRIFAKINLVLKRNYDQKILWKSEFLGERTYNAPSVGTPGLNSADATYNHSAHYQNIAQLAKDMMAEAHDRLTENF